MENISEKPRYPRGRPKLYGDQLDRFLMREFTNGFSRRARTDAFHRLQAMHQFVADPRFAWLCSDVAANGNPRGHVRGTILAELGRIDDKDVREAIALDLCEQKPTARQAVVMIRAYRLGKCPSGTPRQLSDALIKILSAYLTAHPDMEWDGVREALARLQDVVDVAERESN